MNELMNSIPTPITSIQYRELYLGNNYSMNIIMKIGYRESGDYVHCSCHMIVTNTVCVLL